ncbi:hypothetical protein JCGZ_05796 [Jatropha curcas]|uniref:Uncharacterized protein n=1 Tax=Jatropha curcas TaxID=180498 RepID=A0A067KQ81_JATCU|nr:hypothetical protein JCGZ_05796 [Jatropha curcas]
MLKVAWEKLCALRYADFTYRMRKSCKKQQCVSQEIWESWQKAWEDPTFKRKHEIFVENRRSETGGDGAGPSRHTAGSGPQPDHSAEEITALRARVDEQERQLAKLRAHVMRMSGQPSAGTSSSNPPPATDQDVSIAQQ